MCKIDVHFTRLVATQLNLQGSISPNVQIQPDLTCTTIGAFQVTVGEQPVKDKYCYGTSPQVEITSRICQPGTHHLTASTCDVCPVGHYQPEKAQSTCLRGVCMLGGPKYPEKD